LDAANIQASGAVRDDRCSLFNRSNTVMDLNPYESPKPGEPFEERSMGDSGSVQQLLTEIRDAQREMLNFQREALQFQQQALRRQQGLTRFSRAFMVIPILIMIIPLILSYYSLSRIRALPVPPRTPTRTFPSTIPKSSQATGAKAPTVAIEGASQTR
jgi:hypothetical protein